MRLFGTSGIRGNLFRITPSFAIRLGEALALFFKKRDISTATVGRDFRSSSLLLSRSLISSLNACGIDVLDLGAVPTPVLSFFSDAAGAMVTASHNPPDNNGFKCFLKRREFFTAEEDEVEGYFKNEKEKDWQRVGFKSEIDAIPEYMDGAIAYAKGLFGSLPKRKIVVDCGNGVGSLVSPILLRRCGCDVVTINGHEDSSFLGRGPEPSNEFLSDLRKAVCALGADVGFALDGDADRISVVDECGNIIPEDSLIALLGGFYRKKEEDLVLTSCDTSFRIEEHCKNVSRMMLGRLHEGIDKNVVFAGEPWKHIHPSWGRFIDGLVSSLVILGLMKGKKVSQLCADIPCYPQKKIALKKKGKILEKFSEVISKRKDLRNIDTISGVRANFQDNSWILVRPSGTEDKIRVVIEGKNEERLKELEELFSLCHKLFICKNVGSKGQGDGDYPHDEECES